jgi:hypothetical protein
VAQQDIPVSQIPPGLKLTYIGDIASGAIRPEDCRFEALTFSITISPTGQIVAQDPQNSTVQIVSRYNFVLERIYGSIENEQLAGAAASLVKFNLQEQGRNFTVFKRPIDFAALVEGCSAPYHWDGVYICIPGTQFEVLWFVDAAWPSLVGGTRRINITVTGTYIACEPTQA